jgi:hypothetical protein
MSGYGTKRPVGVALHETALETKPSFAYRQCLPTANPKAAIAYDTEVVFIQLTAARRLPPSRASLFA